MKIINKMKLEKKKKNRNNKHNQIENNNRQKKGKQIGLKMWQPYIFCVCVIKKIAQESNGIPLVYHWYTIDLWYIGGIPLANSV